MYALYRSRHVLGWLPAALAAVLIACTLQRVPLKIQPSYDEPPVQLALAEPEPETEATPPVPEVETPPPPVLEPESEPMPDVPPVVTEQSVAPPPPPKPRVEPTPQPKPKPKPKPKPRVEHHPKPVAKPQPVTAPVATPPKAVEAAPHPAPPAPPPPKPRVDTQALEGGYLHGVRGDLERYKQYPTGRQASLERPSGKVVVWLLIDRNGKVLDRGLEERASSILLNRAATSSLARIEQVKPFPPEAFAGRSQLRITATFDYSPR
ncbi:energy transducer TonB family protein [Pseudomonas sp. JBR1]|uniref:energy transducer TonB family protein n=1 Tax=Pseudomonas sp. JBR1 TaxID=3020907 RepID=UPI0023053BD4|nr:energy transducer TonB [Pseudomonas sp. JBR1]WCE06733.1 energy transducer TonB [Pseudomonas sp. JBR1]